MCDEKLTEGEGTTEEFSAMAVVLCGESILATNEWIYGKAALSLPKGHREEGERLIETAIRECFEETGIVISEADAKRELPPFSYEFLTPSGERIRKTITPFLFEVESMGTPTVKEKRILSVEWMKLSDFLDRCTYENVKNALGSI